MLRLTRQTDYAIVLLTQLAARPEEAQSAADLAEGLQIPLPMAGKTLKVLARAGLLVSHRGMRGGYGLARPALEISVADIIAAIEGPIAMTDCADPHQASHDCARETVCSVRGHLQLISRAVAGALQGITLAEMARPAVDMAASRLVTLGAGRRGDGAAAAANAEPMQ